MAIAAILVLPVAALLGGWLDRLPIRRGKAGAPGARSPRARSRTRCGTYGAAGQGRRRAAGGAGHAGGPLALRQPGRRDVHRRHARRDEARRLRAAIPTAKADARLSLYVTEDTIFLYRAALKELPAGTELNVVVGRESYRVLRRAEGTAERFFAEVRPSLVVEMADRRLFEEAVWQLARPLDKAKRARAGAGARRAVDAVCLAAPRSRHQARADRRDRSREPAAAMGSVRGQTLLITGRVEGELLYVSPRAGRSAACSCKDLFKAAEDADVNLVVLQATSTPRQPGGRNWLWQKVEVQGLDEALAARAPGRFPQRAGRRQQRRLLVVALPSATGAPCSTSAGDADLPGAAVEQGRSAMSSPTSSPTSPAGSSTTAVQANLRSAERQQELDQRIVPGIPSDLQLGYLALIVLGLIGVPVSRAWWQRLWPPELQAEYAGRAGYWAALRGARRWRYALVFLPLTASLPRPTAWSARSAMRQPRRSAGGAG